MDPAISVNQACYFVNPLCYTCYMAGNGHKTIPKYATPEYWDFLNDMMAEATGLPPAAVITEEKPAPQTEQQLPPKPKHDHAPIAAEPSPNNAAQILAYLATMEQSKIPVAVKSMTINLTDEKLTMELTPSPWISFSFINDGPNNVYFEVNQGYVSDEAPIKPNEAASVDMKYPAIYLLTMKAALGGTATLRLKAEVGIRIPWLLSLVERKLLSVKR